MPQPNVDANADLVVLYEHPEWQRPLFDALTRHQVAFAAFDLKEATFSDGDRPVARLYFNQASPSAYLRGNTRAVPFALAMLRHLEANGARVVNGSRAFSLELSKSAQADLLHSLGLRTPRSIVFNAVAALAKRVSDFQFPGLLKPEQGGSGARMYLVHSINEIERIFENNASLWLPDNLFLLQEYFPVDPSAGIVRMEFLGGELLYAMRVISNGRFNLCPSEMCNPVDGNGACEITISHEPPVQFLAYPEVPAELVEAGKRIVRAGGLDIGGVEYLVSDGEAVFYDINANSNLRPAIAREYGFDPFDRVVRFLRSELERNA